MFTRCHLALLTVVALTTLGATASARSTLSTEEAMELLTRPGSVNDNYNHIDYHGIVPSFLEKQQHKHFGINRQELVVTSSANDGDDTEVEAQRERNGHSRIRLNVDQYPPKDQIPDVNHPQVKA
ncbi:hypothetical protein BGX23_010013 [Mortierella sp. AD031]|nr:hypothetical protein BGX23_010013 [Mortierella sp. AD031]KAG0216829.1 hypothetical protein BGX33_012049 [Mortierella sp. NVP41]